MRRILKQLHVVFSLDPYVDLKLLNPSLNFFTQFFSKHIRLPFALRPEFSIRNNMLATNVSENSSSLIKKQRGAINFRNIFKTIYQKVLFFLHVISIKLARDYRPFSLFILRLEIQCAFYVSGTFQFR